MTTRQDAAVTTSEIAERRRALGWTQALLSVRSGVSMRTVSTVENGGEISPRALASVVSALEEGEAAQAAQPKEPQPEHRVRVMFDRSSGRTLITGAEGDPSDVARFVADLLAAEAAEAERDERS